MMSITKISKAPERKILQVLGAKGWWVVFLAEDGYEFVSPLAAWALVEERSPSSGHSDRELIGMDAAGDALVCFVDETSNFLRYEFGERKEDLELATGAKERAAA